MNPGRGCEGKAYLVWSFSHHSSLFLIDSKLSQFSPARVCLAHSTFLSLLSHDHSRLISPPCFAREEEWISGHLAASQG